MCRFLCVHNILTHLGKCQGVGLMDHMVRLVLINAKLTSKAAGCTILHPYQQWVPVPACSNSSLSAFGVLSVLNLSYCNKCVVVSRFNLWFHSVIRCWESFYRFEFSFCLQWSVRSDLLPIVLVGWFSSF